MCAVTKSNLESIEDFIFNQDKIVTYRWLSQKLKIHANTSKQLLYTYSLKNTDDNLLVTYLISGTTPEGVTMFIVNQSQVDKVKSSLDKVISEHVYSIQKSSSSVSSSDIYLADSSVENSNKLGSISPRVVEQREFKVVVSEKPATLTKPALSSLKPQEKVRPEIQDKSKTVSPTKINKKPNNLNTLFSKQNAANAEKQKSENPSHKEEAVKQKASRENETKSKVVSPTKTYKKAKEGTINTLFSKQIALNAGKKKSENSLKEEVKRDNVKKLNEDEPMDEEGQDDDSEQALQPEKTVLKTPVGKQKKSTKPRSSKRKSKQHDDTPVRKRKRIVLASDSESGEDEEDEMDIEEEPEPEPAVLAEVPDSDEEVIPPTPFGDKVRRKIRKQVDRTFTDEDGFVVTRKEFVYESCSDDEKDREEPKGDIDSTTLKKLNKDEEKSSTKLDHPDEKDEKKEKLDVSNKEDDNKEEDTKTKKAKGKEKSEKKPAKGKPKSPKKVPQKSNNKQASITSFFSKK